MNNQAFKKLLSESTQVDIKRRKEIEKSLAKEAPAHISSLAELVASEEVSVRRGAVEILRRIVSNEDALKLLIARLGTEPDVKTRRRIAAAIADSEQSAMSGPLLDQLVREEHRFVQASLILALGKLGFRDWPQHWLDFMDKDGPVGEAMRKAQGHATETSANRQTEGRPSGTYLLQDYPGLERLVRLELQVVHLRPTVTEAGWLVLSDLKDDALGSLERLRTIIADFHLGLSFSSDGDIQGALTKAIGNMLGAAPYLQKPCAFRLSLPTMSTRDEYRKLVVKLSRHLAQLTGWVNNPSDYDLDLRVVNLKSKDAVIWRDRRWISPRQNESRVAAPASIHPSVAASLCFAATESELSAMMSSGGVGKVLLDPCCGAGTILSEWLQLFPQAKAIGFDISKRAIQLSEQNLKAFPTRAQLRVSDMRDTPLQRSSVDFIACNLPFGVRVKHEVSNRTLYQEFVKEALRVLRPGGALVTYTADRWAIEAAFRSQGLRNVEPLTRVGAGGLDVTIHRILRRSAPQ